MSSRTTQRKQHTKARTGCKTCRMRKVKCDEALPSCRNCLKRGTPCDFLQRPDVSLLLRGGLTSVVPFLPTGPHAAVTFAPDGFDHVDLELLHHFTTITSSSFDTEAEFRTIYRVYMPQIGFQNTFVLHALLSVAAVHRARLDTAQTSIYLTRASMHHSIASSIAHPLFSNINNETSVPLSAFSILTFLFALSRPRQLVNEGDTLIPAWIFLFRGTKSIMDISLQTISSSVLAPFVSTEKLPLSATYYSMCCGSAYDTIDEGLNELQLMFESHKHMYSHQKLEALSDAVLRLKETILVRNIGIGQMRTPLGWLAYISDEYVALLKELDNEALCVFAFFCACLSKFSSFWCLDGWANTLMELVYTNLGASHRLWVNAAMEEMAWIPQTNA